MVASDLTAFRDALRGEVRGEVYLDDVTLGIYATDASSYQMKPVAVAVPRDEEDVRAAVGIAAEHGVSVLARAGGTSLAGQTVGASLVLDCSKHMNRILEWNLAERWVRVEPGVVCDQLNVELAPFGMHFAIDPATADRACVGGMIGNNSSGTRSILYGKTVDHVRAMRVLLAGGEVLELAEMSPEAYAARAGQTDREGEIYRGFRRVIEANREEIARRFPRVMRRVSGYNLDEFIGADRWNLSKLLSGSEGTLGFTLEARLRLEARPAATALCVAHFADEIEAVRAVPAVLQHGPSAVEIFDRTIIALARGNPNSAALCDFLEGDPGAVLLIEFYGDSPGDAARKVKDLAADMRARGMGYAHPVRTDAAGQARVWAVRKNGLGLVLSMRGERKPVPFMEDACVPVERLPDYIQRVEEICARLRVEVTMYAHVSVGVLHVRPILDLKKQADIDLMKTISDEAFELVKEYGGSWSSEHGDGLARSPFVERFFGPQIYAAFKEVKHLFDPRGLMNPGKIVDAPPMEENLRYGPRYREGRGATSYAYRDYGSFAAAVEMCTGVGVCRRTLDGAMCPSYRATRDEEHTTRGRANALRLAMSGQLGRDAMGNPRLHQVLDLCLSCKACKTECPSNVDMARLKSEFLQMYRGYHGASRRDRLVARTPALAARLAGWPAPLVNRVQGGGVFRRALERWVGVDRRRRLPSYAREPFFRWFARSGRGRSGARQVVLFDDTYMNYHEPHVGRAAVELLESCGYEVILARAGCCQRPRISHGFLREARREGEKTLRRLNRYVEQGLPIVVCEPSCASALTDDLPDLIADADLGRRIAENVSMIDVFLAREVEQGHLRTGFCASTTSILLHGHCHQKALFGTAAMKSLLGRVPGLAVAEVEAGCCGMAGSFGYEKEHYDLSRKVGEDRLLPAIRGRSPETEVVACGFSCRHEIADATGVRARHWVEVLRGTGAEE